MPMMDFIPDHALCMVGRLLRNHPHHVFFVPVCFIVVHLVEHFDASRQHVIQAKKHASHWHLMALIAPVPSKKLSPLR